MNPDSPGVVTRVGLPTRDVAHDAMKVRRRPDPRRIESCKVAERRVRGWFKNLCGAGRSKADMRTLLIAIVTSSLVAAAAPAAGQPRARSTAAAVSSLRVSSDAIEALVSRVMPSVVQVIVTGYRPLNPSAAPGADVPVRRQRTTGSGVVVDSGGYILTNAHVVSDAERVQVVIPAEGAAGRAPTVTAPEPGVLEARVLGTSEELDLALLRVETTGLPALPLADYEALRQGELVFAFGSPDALRNSVSMGVVSAVAQLAKPGSQTIWIQTDAAVNPGNSGGPLVNADGELVGLNTFIRTMSGGSEGLGFALPSSVVALAYPQLRDYGHLHQALLGIVAEPITPALRRGLSLPPASGVIVADAAPQGPAAAAGLRIGDVITAIGGQPLESLPLARFNLLMLALADGQPVAIRALRDGHPLALTITASIPGHTCARSEAADNRANVIERLGFIGAAIDASMAAVLPTLRAMSGVVVVVRLETPHAPEVSLARGDVIHAVNGTWVATPAELRDALDRIAAGDPLVLQIERNGALSYLVSRVE
jgi:serine protease Do